MARHGRIAKAAKGMAAAVAALALVPAAAQAACPATPTVKAFKAFGDSADYSLLPGGAFEASPAGWALTRAGVTAGNEPWKVRAKGDARSLTVQPTGQAVSAPFCVGAEHPHFRFFARQASGTWAGMNVKLRYTDAAGRTRDTVVGSLGGGEFSGWGATRPLPLATSLPLSGATKTLQVRLVFDPEDAGGAWAIDDVYIDPFRK